MDTATEQESKAGVPLVSIDALKISASSSAGPKTIIDNLSLDVRRGEVLGVVGESGSGKSMTARAILGLLPPSVSVTGGTIKWNQGGELLDVEDSTVASFRGSKVSAVFQDPSSGLNPVVPIGRQLYWAAKANMPNLTGAAAKRRALEYLDLVGLESPRRVYKSYPHELSGGMRQRALIAMALLGEPELLLADEPTTALDVTSQARILELLSQLKRDLGLTLMIISHDLPVISNMCDRITVMYSGQVVEAGRTESVLGRPTHPYTHGLLEASVTLDESKPLIKTIPGASIAPHKAPPGCPFTDRCLYSNNHDMCRSTKPPKVESSPGSYAFCHFPLHSDGNGQPRTESIRPLVVETQAGGPSLQGSSELVLTVEKASKIYRQRGSETHAVKEASLALAPGGATGLVGESGSGKTTVSRMILRLTQPTSGRVMYRGSDVWQMKKQEEGQFRSDVQLVQQNPYSSLNPRLTMRNALTEPLRIRGVSLEEAEARAEDTLRSVGMDSDTLLRRPGAFSGGQRQRLVIARALVVNPKILVLDEPVSALDVSVQAQVLELLRELQSEFSLTYLFVSHDLGVVNYLCDQVSVMQSGTIVESGTCSDVLHNPQHDYTKGLIASVPTFERNPREPVG